MSLEALSDLPVAYGRDSGLGHDHDVYVRQPGPVCPEALTDQSFYPVAARSPAGGFNGDGQSQPAVRTPCRARKYSEQPV
jgi:hypothetical protein